MTKAEIQLQTFLAESHLYLPDIRYGFERIGESQCESPSANDFYDAFIDYFYTASVSASDLQGMLADLLFLALKYEVADLRDDCVQYVQGSDSIIWDWHPKHFTAFLSLGLEFNSKPVITGALQLVKRISRYLDSVEFKQLMQRFPHIQDLISQAVRSKSLDEAMKTCNNDAP